MSKVVFKYQLRVGLNRLTIKSKEIISVVSQRNNIIVYAMIDEEMEESYEYDFLAIGTGFKCPDDIDSYLFLGTVPTYEEELIWHVFYKRSKETSKSVKAFNEICKECDTRCRLKMCEGKQGDFRYCYRPVGSLDNISPSSIISFNTLNELVAKINQQEDELFHVEADTVELQPYGRMYMLIGQFVNDEERNTKHPIGYIAKGK